MTIDLNQPEQVAKIAHLFDKVVVDCSVLKHFYEETNHWAILAMMLKKNRKAELITEAWKGVIPFSSNVTLEEIHRIRKETNEGIGPQALLGAGRCFEEVIYIDNKPYPYDCQYAPKGETYRFIIARGPNLSEFQQKP